MTTTTTTTTTDPKPVGTASGIDGRATERGAFATLAHGVRLTPEFREGLVVTLLLALLATAGRVVVPVAVQQTIDNGLQGEGGPDLGLVRLACGLALLAVIGTAVANFFTNVRLYRTTENGLSALRVRAFRRVHDLSVLHQAAERRGSLVSRVTSDVDTMSTFMQWGGLLIMVSAAQLTLATMLMLFWSWHAGFGDPGFAMPWGPQPLLFVALMLSIGLLASWLGTLCWNEASQRLPPALAGQLIVFETLAALTYAFLWRAQWPQPLTWLGVALLMAGVMSALRSGQTISVSPHPESPP